MLAHFTPPSPQHLTLPPPSTPPYRLLAEGANAPAVFVVGFDAEDRVPLLARLDALGCILISPIPTHHQLVKARPSDMQAMVQAFPTATVVGG